MKWDETCGTSGSAWLLAGTPAWRLSPPSLFSHCNLSRKCSCTAGSWSAGCRTSVPAVLRAATGECVVRQEERMPAVHRARCWRVVQSALTGRTRQPTTQVLLQAACLSGILPSSSENSSWHPRTSCCFKPYTLGLDKPSEPTHSDSSPLGQEKSPHCWPACSRWSFILLMWKAVPCTPKTAHPHAPPFLSCNKTPSVGCSSTTTKIRSWVYYFKLGI